MSKVYRLEIRLSKQLLVLVKEVKSFYNFDSYEKLLDHLLSKISRPEKMQDQYELVYGKDLEKKIDARISKNLIIKFNTFSAVFQTKTDTLDYLIDKEKTGRYNVVQF